MLMGEPVQGHVQRPTLAAADRAAVHGFAGLFRSAAGLAASRLRLLWETVSGELRVLLLLRQLSDAIVDFLAGQ